MMRRSRMTMAAVTGAALALAAGLSGCQADRAVKLSQDPVNPLVVALEFATPEFASAPISPAASKQAFVLLPPGYAEGSKRYPVVYFCNGHSDNPDVTKRLEALSAAMAAGTMPPFILVCVDNTNDLGGTFGVNSPLTGQAEDYVLAVAREVVDRQFRTIATPEGRAITGFSMGGFIAMNLALRHPDVFSVAAAYGGGFLRDDELPAAQASWGGWLPFLQGYGAAFAYAASSDPADHQARILRSANQSSELTTLWLSGFGQLGQKLDAYLALGKPLRGILISYGSHDSFAWIRSGSEELHRLMAAKGIGHDFLATEGFHIFDPEFFGGTVFPWVAERLATAE